MPLASTHPKFVHLQKILNIPVFSIGCMKKVVELGSKKKCYFPCKIFCIAVEVDEDFNNFKKIFILLSSIIRVKILKRNVIRYNLKSLTVLAVYPSVSNPVCVYQLSSKAEEYALSNILPQSELSVVGIIKRFLESILNTSLSVGGFCIVLEVENHVSNKKNGSRA